MDAITAYTNGLTYECLRCGGINDTDTALVADNNVGSYGGYTHYCQNMHCNAAHTVRAQDYVYRRPIECPCGFTTLMKRVRDIARWDFVAQYDHNWTTAHEDNRLRGMGDARIRHGLLGADGPRPSRTTSLDVNYPLFMMGGDLDAVPRLVGFDPGAMPSTTGVSVLSGGTGTPLATVELTTSVDQEPNFPEYDREMVRQLSQVLTDTLGSALTYGGAVGTRVADIVGQCVSQLLSTGNVALPSSAATPIGVSVSLNIPEPPASGGSEGGRVLYSGPLANMPGGLVTPMQVSRAPPQPGDRAIIVDSLAGMVPQVGRGSEHWTPADATTSAYPDQVPVWDARTALRAAMAAMGHQQGIDLTSEQIGMLEATLVQEHALTSLPRGATVGGVVTQFIQELAKDFPPGLTARQKAAQERVLQPEPKPFKRKARKRTMDL